MRDTKKTIAFDLDDVLCVRPKEFEYLGIGKYNYCTPIQEMIDIVNKCYDLQYKVIIYSARGMDHFQGKVEYVYSFLFCKTETQLLEWGVKYDKLVMGKHPYDILIDDKAVNSASIKSLEDIESFLE